MIGAFSLISSYTGPCSSQSLLIGLPSQEMSHVAFSALRYVRCRLFCLFYESFCQKGSDRQCPCHAHWAAWACSLCLSHGIPKKNGPLSQVCRGKWRGAVGGSASWKGGRAKLKVGSCFAMYQLLIWVSTLPLRIYLLGREMVLWWGGLGCGGGRESLGKEWILCLADRASITLLSPHTPSQK